MLVHTIWPGGTLQDTIDQVTDRIERKLTETPSLDYLRSATTAGQSLIYVNLRDSTPPGDVAGIWYEVRKKVGDIASTLPSGVLGPFFNDEFGDTFGIIYGFVGDDYSYRELRDWANAARARILRLPNIGKVELVGTQDQKIYIEFSARRLASLGIDPNAVAKAIQEQNAVTPSGIVTAGGERTILRVSGAIRTAKDLRNLNFPTSNGLVRLGDVVTVYDGYADPPEPVFRVNGKRAVGLAISMAKGGDILALGERVKATMNAFEGDLPIGINVVQVSDQPRIVTHAIADFTRALTEAVAIVLAVSFLTLGLRAGLVVAVAIPLVLAITFLAMDLRGIALQRVSLGALIIALGLLVDDAMITVEMMIAKLEEGMDRVKAASFAYTSTAFPMLTGTLVTVAGFIPVAYAKSSAGEYANSLFWVIGFALVISWLVAIFFAPLIGIVLLPQTIARKGEEREGPIRRAFRRALTWAMVHRFFVVAATVVVFLASLGGATLLKQQFFPPSDRPELLLDLTLAQDASQAATAEAVARVEAELARDKDIASWSFYVGEGAIRFYLPMDVEPPAAYRAQAVLVTKDEAARERVRMRVGAMLAEKFPDITTRIAPLEMGPPVGWPVQYRISGEDPERVRELAWRLADIVGAERGTQSVNLDWNEPIKVVRIEVDQDRARLVGFNSSQLAQAILAIASGVTVTQVRDSIYLVDVVGRAEKAERLDLNTFRSLQLPVGGGHSVPLANVARIEYETEQPVIWQRKQLPTITVQADSTGPVGAETLVKRMEPRIAAFRAELPPDYTVEVGGITEQSDKGLGSVLAVVPLMLIIMLAILMAQLQSIQRLLLVLSVAPLGLIGVVAAMLPTGTPMGFIAVLGVIALVGMIVRNSVILIDQIETHRRGGQDPWHAVIDATVHRMRPILLTAAAAILGMIPIAREVFWIPLAYAVIGGLAVATVLTLIFLPALYAIWFRIGPPATDAGQAVREPAERSASDKLGIGSAKP